MEPKKLILVPLALIAIVMGAWMSYRLATPPPVPQRATVLSAPGELPEFSLLDQAGQPFARNDFAGHWNLVFFGFTHCPDICPTTLQVLSSARNELGQAGQMPLPRIVLVSVDPERDTPDVIGHYVGYFGEDNVGITGDLDELRKLTNGLGIFFEKSNDGAGNYSVDHSAVVIVINPDARFEALFGAPHEIENFVHDLPIIMAGQ